MLLGVETDDERGNVDDLLADTVATLVSNLGQNMDTCVLTGCDAGG